MRARSRFESPRLIVPLLLVLVACAVAAPLEAQHCWPSNLALVVHDSGGAIIHPQEFDTVTYSPVKPDSADTQFAVRRLGAHWKGVVPEGTHALYWWGEGDCRVYVDEVRLTHGGRVMRLRLNVRLDTDARPGPTEYVLMAPPFAEGTWELVQPLPPGRLNRPVRVPAASGWRRVAESGGG
jgi:hypothetical protein